MRMGDVVHHKPSGEDWIVLYVDGFHLAPMGWPACEAKLADCNLVEACSDDEHQRWIARVQQSTAHRGRKALRLAGVSDAE